MVKNYSSIVFLVSILCLITLALFLGCSQDEKSTKIGYIGCLSGKCLVLGVSGLSGVNLAVEKINNDGGIVKLNKKAINVELVVADTKGDPQIAKKAFMDLIDSGVSAVIGPMTSQMGVHLKPLADSTETVLLSPTVSTPQLSGMDDYFFRIMAAANIKADVLARYATIVDKQHSFVIAYDETNNAFTDIWIDAFSESVKEYGGRVIGLQPLNNTLPMQAYAKRINDLNPDGLLIVANAHSTGMLIQQLNKLGSAIQIMGTEWSTTGDLISNSGRALEKAYFITSFDERGQEAGHLEFVNNYIERYRETPSFAAKFGYEAMFLLSSAIANSSDSIGLKESFATLGPVEGLQEPIKLDRYGDVQRNVYVAKFKDNGFWTIAKVNGTRIEVRELP